MLGFFLEVLLPFVLVLSLVVFVHEYGHYLAARLGGVAVQRFSLGFGPRLWSWRDRSGTEWALSAIPLGGYVRIEGRPADGVAGTAFDDKPAWFRLVVIAAGPAANLVLAMALMFGYFAAVGVPATAPQVTHVYANSPAEAAGVAVGDRILAVDGRRVASFAEIDRYVALRLDAPVALTMERGGERLALEARPIVVNLPLAGGRSDRVGLVGMAGEEAATRRFDLPAVAAQAVRATVNTVGDTLHSLGQLLLGERSYKSLVGVVGMADLAGSIVAQSGFLALVAFTAMISVNIGVVNLLPVPVLDGGQMVLVGVEMVARRPLPAAVRDYAGAVGVGVLTAIIALTTWNDVAVLV